MDRDDLIKSRQAGGTPPAPDIGDNAWAEVLEAVDRTYAELVDYQEQLELRNAELLSLRRLLGSIMESMTDYLVAVDRSGNIEEASDSFCAVTGFAKPLLEGSALERFVLSEDRAALGAALSQVMAGRSTVTLELRIIAQDRSEPVEFKIAPRLDRRRKGVGVVLTGRPLGELRRMYSELAASHDALKEAQGQLVRNEKLASLGRLLAGVAHELNNPISFVYANTHALEKYLSRFEAYFDRVQAGASREELVALRDQLKLERDLKNVRTAIVGARDGAERVRDIVEDLRRLSADGTGEMAPFDLVETARSAARWIERGTKTDVSILFDGAETCEVVGRPGHIQQVLLNLVQNAIDAAAGSEASGVRIDITCKPGWAILEITDSGPGVPPGEADRIFDPFFTTKPVGKGTGLGLSISHKITQEHGGTLQLVDAGPGATFRLSLPRRSEA